MIGMGLNPSLRFDALIKHLNQEVLALFAFLCKNNKTLEKILFYREMMSS